MDLILVVLVIGIGGIVFSAVFTVVAALYEVWNDWKNRK